MNPLRRLLARFDPNHLVGIGLFMIALSVAMWIDRASKGSNKEAIAARAVIESGQTLIQAQQYLIAALEVQLVLLREERDTWKKLVDPQRTNDGRWKMIFEQP